MAVNNKLQQFTYSISHDLRAPLNSIQGLLEVLQLKLQYDEGAMELIKLLLSVTTRSCSVVDDLIQYISIGNKKCTKVICDFNKIVANVEENLDSLIKETNAEITIKGTLPKLPAIRSSMERLLQNIISNGIKFRKRNSIPNIIICSEERETCWVFHLTDNGLGIPEDHFKNIFSPFRRFHPHKKNGTGLGLAISKEIVELHGGQILVSSVEGEGSTFSFTLPK